MLYDQHPVYPHQQHLPWAHEPWKTLYVLQRILSTLTLVPCWIVYYTFLPRSYRPRRSWSLTQIVLVKFMKRIYRVTEVAGVTWNTRDPKAEPNGSTLRETRFAWVPPLPEQLRTGIVDDKEVSCQQVGTYIWPKETPSRLHMRCAERGRFFIDAVPSLQNIEHAKLSHPSGTQVEAESSNSRVIGVFLHGGGYCHMSAHEKSGTSRIPRRLMRDKLFEEIHAVEYRLLQHAPTPGAIQDAAAVYAHLVTHHLGAQRGADGAYRYPNTAMPYHTHTASSPTLDGIESVGIQGVLSQPSLSTSCSEVIGSKEKIRNCKGDTTHRPNEAQLSGNDTVPTPSSPEGSDSSRLTHDESGMLRPAIRRPKVVLIGDSAGGNLVLALARWIRDEGVLPSPDGMLLLSPSCDPSHTLPQVPASRRPRPHASTDYLLDTPEPRAVLQRAFLGRHPVAMVYSPYISPASECVLAAFHGHAGMGELEPARAQHSEDDTRDYRENPGTDAESGVPADYANPYICVPDGQGLFTSFPRALVVVGDAERLEREVVALAKGMEHDGVRVQMVWAPDGVHDILMLKSWDERVRENVWRAIGQWVAEVTGEE